MEGACVAAALVRSARGAVPLPAMGDVEVCINYSDTGIVFALLGIGNPAANIIAGFLSEPRTLIVVRGNACLMALVCRFPGDERYIQHTLRRRLS